jgi:hypothetical protein
MVDWGTIELEVIIKLSDSRFIEPTYINVVYDNETYKVEFDEIISTIDVKRNLGKFKLKRPYVKILSASKHCCAYFLRMYIFLFLYTIPAFFTDSGDIFLVSSGSLYK